MQNRFPLNVEGDFYTSGTRDRNGEWCGDYLDCALPEQEAPTLFAPLGDDHYDAYFIKQPETEEELQQAINAADVCCVNAVRYGGKNKDIIKRMLPDTCDHKISSTDKVIPASNRWWQLWK